MDDPTLDISFLNTVVQESCMDQCFDLKEIFKAMLATTQCVSHFRSLTIFDMPTVRHFLREDSPGNLQCPARLSDIGFLAI